jgi:uncharacterized protein YlxW (UPF0749 family)
VHVARRPWALLVPLTALGAGLLFATSASTAQGTDLRVDRRLQLTELIARERAAVERRADAAAELRRRVDAASAAVAERDSRVTAAAAPARLEVAAGVTAVRGPAVTVTLDDAPASRAVQRCRTTRTTWSCTSRTSRRS